MVLLRAWCIGCRHVVATWVGCRLVPVFLLQLTVALTALADDHSDLTWYRDTNAQVARIGKVDEWKLRRQLIIEGMQQAMGKLPSFEQLPPFEIQVLEDVRIDTVRRLTLTIQVESGDRLPLDLYLPQSLADAVNPGALTDLKAETRYPAMLALHPTGPLGKRIVAGESPRGNRQYGLELALRGYVTICPDYPSFGQYQYDFGADRYESGTMKGIFNHMRCVDFLTALACVDPDRIGVIGHSLGGHNAMFVAAFDERLKITVSSCGWTPFHDYYGGNITGWTSDVYMPRLKHEFELNPDKVPFDFYEVVAALAPRTFVSLSPLHDANFDVTGVRRAVPRAAGIYALLEAAPELILVTPDCAHDFPADMRERAYREIDRVLAHQPTSIPAPDYSAELPRIPPHSPADALSTFRVAAGFELQQAAAEPLVTDPVAMAFDADGRLFVVEMRDYSEQATERLGRIRLLIDGNHDGVFEESHIFAEDLSWPTAITCYDGGVFVGAAPEIYFFRDSDGDHRADVREVVYTGFGRTNVQGLLNCFHWGPDNRIYGQTSSSGARITQPAHPERPLLELRGRDFSFDPRTREIRPESGGAQHGMCFDDWGNRFVCSNSDHAQAIIYSDRYLSRSPKVSAAPPRVSIAVDGGQAPVFRASPVEPWRIVRTRLRASGVVAGIVEGGGRPAGYFTGSTGINVYRGDAWPESLQGTLVMADVGSNIVHRKRATPSGVSWTATRIDEASEFVASTDIWFRPVQSANAPDGCLYILDMYREVIEHPLSLPPEIKQHLDLTSGRDRGRLYRLAPTGWTPREFTPLSALETVQLVQVLNHSNGWHRDTASRLLYERQDPAAASALRELAGSASRPQGRIHAMNSLDGQQALTEADVLPRLSDSHPRVREHAVRLAEHFPDSAAMAAALVGIARDEDARVRLQLAFTLGEFPAAVRVPVLIELIAVDLADPWIRTAVLCSLREQTLPAFETMAGSAEFVSRAGSQPVLSDLVELIARQFSTESLDQLAKVIRSHDLPPGLRLELVQRVFRGCAGARQHPGFQQLTNLMIVAARKLLDESATPAADRVAAARSLTLSTLASDGERLFSLLTASSPPDLQLAAVDTIGSFADPVVAERLIAGLSEFSPQVMERARELLLGRSDWTAAVLSAVLEGRLPQNSLTTAELQRLAGHPDLPVREQAAKLLQSVRATPRDEVIQRYREALALPGNSPRGAAVFRQHCSVCHQLNGIGHNVGPNLATIAGRGAETLLVNMLDPNREVNPAWKDYIAVTTAGTTQNGVIISESSTGITLRRAEAKETALLRSDIETLTDTGRSLMPEGLEKQIDPQAVADLIAWLLEQR